MLSTESHFITRFTYLANTIRQLSPDHALMPENGIVFKGNPNWANHQLLLTLNKEAEQRRDKPLDRTDHFLGCGGIQADKLANSTSLVNFVSQHAGKVRATGIASYLYYDKPGLGIRPHVDTDVFSVNLMLMLKHRPSQNGLKSSTLVFPPNGKMENHSLDIGGVMIMFGGAVIHARSIIGPQEKVHLLTIGFNREKEE